MYRRKVKEQIGGKKKGNKGLYHWSIKEYDLGT